MTTLYITRHGETVWNTERRMQGWKDSELTEQGIQQTKLLAEKLKDVHFHAIYSSPLPRTLKTAEILKGERSISITIDEHFKEINLGEWEGLSRDELIANDKEQIENFWYKPHLYVPPFNGESFQCLIQRTAEGIQGVLKKHKGENILIVTHGAALKAIMYSFRNLTLDQFWEAPMIYQTSLTKVKVDEEGKAEIILYADTSHYIKKDNNS